MKFLHLDIGEGWFGRSSGLLLKYARWLVSCHSCKQNTNWQYYVLLNVRRTGDMRLCRCCQNCLVWSMVLVPNRISVHPEVLLKSVVSFFLDQYLSCVCPILSRIWTKSADSHHKLPSERKLNLIGRGCWCASVVMVSNVSSCSTVFRLVWTIRCILQQGRYLFDELTSDYLRQR